MTGWLRQYWPKVVSGLAIAAVAGVTGVISYTHIYRLTLALHQTVLIARLMPFGVDGLIVVGSVVLLQPPPGQRYLGWLGVGPGIVISLFANVESGIRYGYLAAAWAGIPAVAFSLATFMLERWLKAQADPERQPDHVASAADQVAHDAEQAAQIALRGHRRGGQPAFRPPARGAIRAEPHTGCERAQRGPGRIERAPQPGGR